MYNALLDKLPDEFEGWLIRSDYRIALQIISILTNVDDELSNEEKLASSFTLLYGNGIPDDPVDAYKGLVWFLNGGDSEVVDKTLKSLNKQQGITDEQTTKSTTEEEDNAEDVLQDVMDFEIDSYRIKTAFLRTYSIDISKVLMHWFDFRSYMSDLIKDCSFNTVIGYRSTDLNNVPKQQREAYRQMKQKFKLPLHLSKAEENELRRVLGDDYEDYMIN